MKSADFVFNRNGVLSHILDKLAIIFLFFTFLLFSNSASSRELTSDYYDLYYADISSSEYGLDGYPDIYLLPKERFVPVGVGINFIIPLPKFFESKMLCGQEGGSFVECTLGFGAVLPSMTSDVFSFLVGDFNGDKISDGFLHSGDSSLNSLYLEYSQSGESSLLHQFSQVGGFLVSGQVISISNEKGENVSEINVSETNYVELSAAGFKKVRGGELVASVVGASPGVMDVAMGALQYSIPIDLPVGSASINPSFSINYSSQSGYGHLGMGFSLSGMSVIERCATDFHRDGVVKRVSGGSDDKACLDGSRLVLVAGEYWGEGSEYRIESEAFARVVFSNNVFTVEHKNGDIYRYGDSSETRFSGGEGVSYADSRWALAWVGDRLGYGYRIVYEEGTGGAFPAAIFYTLKDGEQIDAADLKVEFFYETDLYLKSRPLFGEKYNSGKRLLGVSLISKGVEIRSWNFNYIVSEVTGRSLLDEYQECGIENACFSATKLNWQQSNDSDFSKAVYHRFPGEPTTAYAVLEGYPSPKFNGWLDLNRDGVDDYCRMSALSDFHSARVEVVCYVNNGNGVFSPGITVDVDLERIRFENFYYNWNIDPAWVDMNADGFIDLCFSRPEDDYDNVECLLNNGSVESPFEETISASIPRPVKAENVINRVWLDFNGDSKVDHCYDYFRDNGNKYVVCSTQDKESFAFNGQIFTKKMDDIGGRWVDVNGDALPDYCITDDDEIECHINDAGQNIDSSVWSKSISYGESPEKSNYVYRGATTKYFSVQHFDFTGNGYPDFCRIVYRIKDDQHGYEARCLESTGASWGDEVVSPFLPVLNHISSVPVYEELPEATKFMDVNRDGYIDWCIENGWELDHKGAELKCYLSDASGFSDELVTYVLPDLGGTEGIRPLREINRGDADIDGDGVREYCALYWKSHEPLDRGIACYGPQEPERYDMLLGAVNGFGLEYEATYTDISNSDVYSYRVGPGEFGQISLTSGLNVVSSFRVSDGVGGEQEQEYFYADYAYDPNGYGGIGFEYIQVISENGNRKSETQFSQNLFDHTAGNILTTQVSYKSGAGFSLINALENTWESVFYDAYDYTVSTDENVFNEKSEGVRFSVRLKESIETVNEITGALISESLTINEHNKYGDLEKQTVSISGDNQEFHKEVLTDFYEPDLTSWVIGRQKRTDVTTWGEYQGEAIPAVTRASSWEYYPSGSPFEGMIYKEVIEPDSLEFRKEKAYTYTEFGLKKSITESRFGLEDRETSYDYQDGRLISSITNDLGHKEIINFDPVTGNKISSIDVNNLQSRFVYDSVGRLTSSFTPSGQSQEIRYKSCALVTSCPEYAVWYTEQWSSDNSGQKMSALARSYKDVLGRTIEVEEEAFNGNIAVVRTVYGSDGNVVKVSEPFWKGDSPLVWSEVKNRDVLGRPTREINAAGLTTETEYLGLTLRKTISWQNPTASEGQVIAQVATSTNDIQGNLRSATDPALRVINYSYDGANQLINVALPDGEHVTTSYDTLGRKVASLDPNMGGWKYAYNGDDQLVLQENGSGRRSCISYDHLGRKTAVTDDYQPAMDWGTAVLAARNGCSGQAETVQWFYDDPQKGLGRLARVEHENGYASEPFYDDYGRILSSESEYDGFVINTSREFDPVTGRLRSATLPHRSSGPRVDIEYRYNGIGHLYEVGERDNPEHYFWRVESKTIRGNVEETLRANGMIRGQYVYDYRSGVLNQIRSKSAFLTEWNIQDEYYTHNAKGLTVERVDGLQEIQERFTYDVLDRIDLVSVEHQSDPALSYVQDPDYDISGNILHRNDVGTYQYERTCEHLGQIYTPGPYAVTSVQGMRNASYCYDNGGNMLSGDGKSIAYTAFNKPTSITSSQATVDMVYGPDRGLIKHTTTTSTKTRVKHSFGSYEHVETLESGQISIKERFTLPGGVVVSYEDGEPESQKEEYLFTDALGSVVAVAGGLSQVTEQYRYDPWGRPRMANWQPLLDADWASLSREDGATGKGFTGHQMLDEVGVIHMGGRIYDPTLGRFMSADPIIKGLANVESYNRYSYVLNSPMSFTDPSGYSWWSENVTDKLRDFRRKYKREIMGIRTLGLSESLRVVSEELARFAARNKYAGEVIGVVGIAICSGASGGTATAVCAGVFQGGTTASIASANGASFGEALRAGLESGALAAANASVAYNIKLNVPGNLAKGVAHGLRGAFFAAASGGDPRSGLAGGFTEGLLGNWIEIKTGSEKLSGTLTAAFLSGTVSEVSGGKFAVGAATGAFGYLANQLAQRKERINLLDHEGVSGAHTIQKHVGKSDNYLLRRMNKPSVRLKIKGIMVFRYPSSMSTFTSLEAANMLVNMTLDGNSGKIQAWLNSGDLNMLSVGAVFKGSSTGRVAYRGGRVSLNAGPSRVHFGSGNAVTVVIRRDASFTNGYSVYTAYPRID